MKNIVEHMYQNLSNPNKVISTEPVYDNARQLQCKSLIGSDVAKLTNGIGKQIGQSNFKKQLGILLPNSNQFVSSFYASILNGHTVVGINERIEIDELNKIIAENNLETIVSNNQFVELFDKAKVNVINLDSFNITQESSRLETSKKNPSFDDIMAVSYTSGTSESFSKGAKLSFENISFVSDEYKKAYSLNDNSQIVTVLPLWHNFAMFACLTSSISANASTVIMPEWDSKHFIDINRQLKPDVFSGSPYM